MQTLTRKDKFLNGRLGKELEARLFNTDRKEGIRSGVFNLVVKDRDIMTTNANVFTRIEGNSASDTKKGDLPYIAYFSSSLNVKRRECVKLYAHKVYEFDEHGMKRQKYLPQNPTHKYIRHVGMVKVVSTLDGGVEIHLLQPKK